MRDGEHHKASQNALKEETGERNATWFLARWVKAWQGLHSLADMYGGVLETAPDPGEQVTSMAQSNTRFPEEPRNQNVAVQTGDTSRMYDVDLIRFRGTVQVPAASDL